MNDIEEIEGLVLERGISLAGPIISHRDEEPIFYVFVKVSTNKNGKPSPGPLSIFQLKNKALEKGYKLSIVAINDNVEELDKSLKAMILKKYAAQIANSFASFAGKKSDIWIEPKANLTDEEKIEITTFIDEILAKIDIERSSLTFTQIYRTPTYTAILRALRTLAPCTADELALELQNRKFSVPSETWMNHTLDKLRKAGLVVRKKSGQHFLSLACISALGTQKSHSSPDVIRALALTKRES